MSQAPDLEFTKALPKVELHAHLTGSISRQCLHEIWQQKKASDPEFALDDPLTAIPSASEGGIDVVSFFPIFDKYIYALVSDVAAITYAINSVLQDFASDGVRYLELRTTPRAIPSASISKEDYVSTVLDAIPAFPFSQMETRLILSVDRKNTLIEAEEVVDLALKYRHRGIVGLDLCGNPTRRPVSHLAPAFHRARQSGLPLTLHFAEVAQQGPEELEMMLAWQPSRLGHVIHVPEDLRKVIRERKLGLELSLSCNVLARLSKGGFVAHHFGEWRKAGVPVALSTDDVGIFESSLSNEYSLAAQHFGLNKSQLVELSRAAVSSIFGGGKQKTLMQNLLDEFHPKNI